MVKYTIKVVIYSIQCQIQGSDQFLEDFLADFGGLYPIFLISSSKLIRNNASFSIKGRNMGNDIKETFYLRTYSQIRQHKAKNIMNYVSLKAFIDTLNFIKLQSFFLGEKSTMYSLESLSNQSTQSARSHESLNPSSKNVLPNLHDALRFEKLKKVNQQFLVRLKEIEAKEKPQYKAVRMIVAFMLAKESLEEDDVNILHRHFLGVCELKIKAQIKKLGTATQQREGFHLRNITILETFADYIHQMLAAPLVSAEFLHRALSFIFRLSEVKGGINGRRDVQEGKVRGSLEYLRRAFNLQPGVEVEKEERAKVMLMPEEQKEAEEAGEDFSLVLEGESFVGISILGFEHPHYQRIEIFLEQAQEKEIRYAGRLSKAQSKTL